VWIWIATWITRMKGVLVWAAVTALACAVVAAWAYRTGHTNGAAAVTAEWMAERAETARATSRALERRIEVETKMRETIDADRTAYRARLAAVAADRDRLADSLRHRPERPAGGADLPRAAAAAPGPAACTGADLYRDDAEVLVRIAADADRLRAAVEHCAAAYDAVRAGLLRLQDRSK
jgi:hypothetical protein